MALIKSPAHQDILREAGKLLLQVYASIEPLVKVGAVPLKIDRSIHQEISKRKATPSFLNYNGYPNASCISVNDQVVHTIPSNEPLVAGDIVTVDIGLVYQGLYVDSARTYTIGQVTPEAERLIAATKEALYAGIKNALAGKHVGAISNAVQKVAEREHLGIVRSYTGHGVGHAVHEDPSIPNYGEPKDGMKLKAGMVIAIEPMFTLGGGEVLTLSDGWTVITNDNTLAAQFEHTVLITETGNEILV